jgi:T4-like virus Myoviridae tail sheath stabiliser
MLGWTYYNETLRKTNALIGTLFNDIVIERHNEDGTVHQSVRIPLHFGPREKHLARLETQPNLETTVAITLPMISFDITGLSYDSNRKLSSTGKILSKAAGTGLVKVFNPVPYDIDYQVLLYSNNIEDGAKMLEQILPFFTPHWAVSVFMLKDTHPTLSTDIYVELLGVTPEDLYEGEFTKRQAFIWTLQLRVKTYFFGPVRTAKVIKYADTYTRVGNTASSQLANKTTWEPLKVGDTHTANSALSVNESDNWGYYLTIEDKT